MVQVPKAATMRLCATDDAATVVEVSPTCSSASGSWTKAKAG